MINFRSDVFVLGTLTSYNVASIFPIYIFLLQGYFCLLVLISVWGNLFNCDKNNFLPQEEFNCGEIYSLNRFLSVQHSVVNYRGYVV